MNHIGFLVCIVFSVFMRLHASFHPMPGRRFLWADFVRYFVSLYHPSRILLMENWSEVPLQGLLEALFEIALIFIDEIG